MGCGCGGGRSYTRSVSGATQTSRHAPTTSSPRYTSPPPNQPRVIQAQALAQRRAISAQPPVRRQV